MESTDKERQALIERYKKKNEAKYSEHFISLLVIYPNRDSTARAWIKYQEKVKTEEDRAAIDIALENYIEHLKNNPWKRPQSTSTWFNNWMEWVAWVEPKYESESTEGFTR